MNIFTLFLYFINWVVLIVFYLKKNKDRKYIFSPFNLSVFIGLFSLLIAPWFFFNDEAWIALGNIKAVELKEQLNICLQINLFGQIIYFLTAYFVEFKNVKNISNELFKELNRFKFAISRNLFIGCIAFWYLIVFIFKNSAQNEGSHITVVGFACVLDSEDHLPDEVIAALTERIIE